MKSQFLLIDLKIIMHGGKDLRAPFYTSYGAIPRGFFLVELLHPEPMQQEGYWLPSYFATR